MAFRGWRAEAIEFFEGLEADNSRAYWQDNKATYDHVVRAPMEELLADLAGEFGAGKIFRPYRDVRFSADKSPYKTSIAATIGQSGYVQLSTDGLGAGAGMWVMEKDQLDRYRRAAASDRTGTQLESVVAGLRTEAIDVTGHHVLKTAPKGYPRDHPRIALLRNQGLIAWKQWDPGAWLGKGSAKDRLVAFLRLARPLNEWLDNNVGPTEITPEGRR